MGNILDFLLEFANSNILEDKDKQIVNNIFNYIEKDTIFKLSYRLVNIDNINDLKKIAFNAAVARDKLIFSLDQYHYVVALEKDVISKVNAYLFCLTDKYGLKEMPKNILERYNKDAKELRYEIDNNKEYIPIALSTYLFYKRIYVESGYEGIARLTLLNKKLKELLGSSIFRFVEENNKFTDDDVMNLTSSSSILNDFSFENQINVIFDICMENKEKLTEETVNEFKNISKSKVKRNDCTLYL